MQFCVDISPDSWVSLPTPANMTVGHEQPAIRYEPTSAIYRMKGSFQCVNSMNVFTFVGQLPTGFAPAHVQAFVTSALANTTDLWRTFESHLVFHEDGTYRSGLFVGSNDYMSFDGIVLIPAED